MRRTLRRLLTAASVLLAATFLLVPAAPAQAAYPTMTICFWAVGDDGIWTRTCYTIDVPVEGPRKWWPKDCWVCLPAFSIDDYWIDPAYRNDFTAGLGKGLALIAEAGLTKDEKLAEQLRAEAAESFHSAAKLIKDGGKVAFKEFGWFEPESGKFYGDPDPEPNFEVRESLRDGFQLMQQALIDPEPQPMIDAAMKEFLQANTALAELAAG